jgi:methanogenic corrinoid protein MtbC1
LYDETDIADVLAIKRQIAIGVSPAQAGAALRRQHEARGGNGSATSLNSPLTAHQIALQNAFLHSDEAAARRALDDAFGLFSIEQVATQIIQPTLETLGTTWMKGELTIAQEHFASNLVRQKLIALIQAQAATALAGFHIVAASAPEEEHELGLLMLVLLARHQGWRVTYLGQRTPLIEMARHAQEQKADAIVVSVTTVLGLASLIPWFMKTSRPNVPIAFGGRILNAIPHLHDHLPGIFLGEDIVTSLKTLTTNHLARKPWAPSKKSLKAALMLREFRFKIASETCAQLADYARGWGFGPETLSHPTLYLIDTLACAIAYDAPALMDAQNEWLGEAMPPRRVKPQMLSKHLQVFRRTVQKNLDGSMAQSINELLDRLKN